MTVDTQKAIATLQRYPAQLGSLAGLKGFRPDTIEAIMQLVPFGERPILEELGIIRSGMPLSNGLCTLEVTEFGFQVIEACPDLVVDE
jgi:hypothetical protein